MKFNFDKIIPRKNTNSFKWDKYKDTDILPFWVADMDFAIAPEIIQAVEQRLQHPIFGYVRAPDDLAPVIKKHLEQEFDWQIEPEWLVWLPGVVAGLSACCRAFGEQGDEAITFPPIYHHFLDVAQPAGKKLVTVPLLENSGSWDIDFPSVEKAISKRSKLMLMCSPHNPVGKIFSKQELQSVCSISAANDMVVVSDEIHAELVLDGKKKHIPTALACPEYAENIVTLMSPSKTFNLAGMNCSFAVIQNTKLRHQFIKACEGVVPMVPAFSYVAALAAYRDASEWRKQLLEYLRGNYDYLLKEIGAMQGLEMTALEATYLAWINTAELGMKNPQKYFEEAGVGFSSGSEFGSEWNHYVRLNFACPRSQLEECVGRMRQAITAYSN